MRRAVGVPFGTVRAARAGYTHVMMKQCKVAGVGVGVLGPPGKRPRGQGGRGGGDPRAAQKEDEAGPPVTVATGR